MQTDADLAKELREAVEKARIMADELYKRGWHVSVQIDRRAHEGFIRWVGKCSIQRNETL